MRSGEIPTQCSSLRAVSAVQHPAEVTDAEDSNIVWSCLLFFSNKTINQTEHIARYLKISVIAQVTPIQSRKILDAPLQKPVN